jgi:murein DD-endopeptidase MepM/ murein hydrolase activator NlpD
MFRERQIYVRSDGRVQFVTLSPLTQAVAVGASSLFLSWIAFASVSTVYHQQIVAAREDNFRQVQDSYETRLADLQMSYDRVHDAFRSAEERFTSVAKDLEARHRTLATLIGTRSSLRSALGLADQEAPAFAATPQPALRGTAPQGVGGAYTLTIPDSASATAPLPSGTVLTSGSVLQGAAPADFIRPDAEVAPAGQAPARPSHSELPRTFLKGIYNSVAALFGRITRRRDGEHASEEAIHSLVDNLNTLYPEQREILAVADAQLQADTKRFTDTMRAAGIDAKRMVARAARLRGSSAHETLPLTLVATDEEFGEGAFLAANSLEEFTSVATALSSVPLVAPVAGGDHEQTSGFGNRRDPFTKMMAFHGGLDFSGPLGSPVRVTAPGVVTYSGSRGAYGKTVEVDHGYGMKTRYGHLQTIAVNVGTKVERGTVIGGLGSTGRSTGPHVHYEIWQDDVVKNPTRFLRAGSDVRQN